MAAGVSAAVAVNGALAVELLEALVAGGYAAVAPHLLALQVECRTRAVEAIAAVVGARAAVFPVDVRRTLTRVAGALLRKIALVV